MNDNANGQNADSKETELNSLHALASAGTGWKATGDQESGVPLLFQGKLSFDMEFLLLLVAYFVVRVGLVLFYPKFHPVLQQHQCLWVYGVLLVGQIGLSDGIMDLFNMAQLRRHLPQFSHLSLFPHNALTRCKVYGTFLLLLASLVTVGYVLFPLAIFLLMLGKEVGLLLSGSILAVFLVVVERILQSIFSAYDITSYLIRRQIAYDIYDQNFGQKAEQVRRTCLMVNLMGNLVLLTTATYIFVAVIYGP